MRRSSCAARILQNGDGVWTITITLTALILIWSLLHLAQASRTDQERTAAANITSWKR